MRIELELAALAIGLLAVFAAYGKLWFTMKTAKQERSAMEIELRSQIAKLEKRIEECERRWHEHYESKS